MLSNSLSIRWMDPHPLNRNIIIYGKMCKGRRLTLNSTFWWVVSHSLIGTRITAHQPQPNNVYYFILILIILSYHNHQMLLEDNLSMSSNTWQHFRIYIGICTTYLTVLICNYVIMFRKLLRINIDWLIDWCYYCAASIAAYVVIISCTATSIKAICDNTKATALKH